MNAKYPRTAHLPWSPGGTRDDRRLVVLDQLFDRTLVLTEKLDGSNLCMTHEAVYARSHSGAPKHPSFDAAKAMHAGLQRLIPRYLSIFGEWCMALHSIKYDQGLPSYFNVFAIRDDEAQVWLSWDKVCSWTDNLGLDRVPELTRTTVSSVDELRAVTDEFTFQPSVYGPEREGVVVRPCVAYADNVFSNFTAKWVRANHVQTDEHWSKGDFIQQPRRTA